MKNFSLWLMIFLFICTTMFVVSSSATNFYERHGNNFIYLDSTGAIQLDTLTYAPVIWDIGTAFFELRNYYASYGWESSSECDSSYNAIDLLMKEAWDHGVNFANARGELFRMDTTALDSGPKSSHYFVNVARIVTEDSLSEDLLLLAVNDSSSDLDYDQIYIYFPTRNDDSFTKNHIAGFDCDPDTLRSETKLRLDFFTMPAYSASLYLLEYTGE